VTIEIRTATAGDAELIARIHADCCEDHWPAESFRSLLGGAGVFGLVARQSAGLHIASFILVRIAADEAEILTLATLPAARGGGLASRLIRAAMDKAQKGGAVRLFLEVAETNEAGRRLYEKLGFEQVARRPRYYESRTNSAVAAVVMRRELSN
jgi:ribosomal protein S18 acetylase RimI-like enzyme